VVCSCFAMVGPRWSKMQWDLRRTPRWRSVGRNKIESCS
jgi:hypothetical protein